ncbi:hypothetical protein VA249_45230 (plasmid) [Vibrio alfacsensis]|uniref:hypothetical protein n=1 Tax=Vibrio alfacsensis TaxID=1074311 RepID=UPI001BF16D95|nr:hypothetical protein [Vibrio alfacsensis]BBM67877.1 hypothetical protein VA249_45230 [Vibrio alfacsensis]
MGVSWGHHWFAVTHSDLNKCGVMVLDAYPHHSGRIIEGKELVNIPLPSQAAAKGYTFKKCQSRNEAEENVLNFILDESTFRILQNHNWLTEKKLENQKLKRLSRKYRGDDLQNALFEINSNEVDIDRYNAKLKKLWSLRRARIKELFENGL